MRNPLRSLRTVAVVAGLVLAAAPAVAQTPIESPVADDPLSARDAKRVDKMEKVVRELRAIVFQLRDTGKPVVVQPADTDARIADLANRIGDLEQSLPRLNSSLDNATRDLDLARRDNATLQAQVAALTDRLAAVEKQLTQAAPGPVAEAPPAADPAPKASAAEAFTEARQLMLSGDYDGAENAFSTYVATYPDSAKAPEARYWLGKTLTVRGASAQAATAYVGAIRGWPQTAWAPDATVELSRSLVALKKPADACQLLAEFAKRYPKAPAAVMSRAAATRTQAKCS